MQLCTTRRALLAIAAGLTLSVSLTGTGLGQDAVNLSFLVDNNSDTIALAERLIADFETANPGINIELESRPGGGEGDNIVKTRLATGEMTDIFLYNSGSLFQALNPAQTMVPMTDQPFVANVLDSFKSVVSVGEDVYGAPIQFAMGGGVLYSKTIYDELGLSVPKSWGEFMANNAAIKEAGKVPVIQTFGDTWTSQLFVLGDFFNVAAAEPDFAERYTANQAKYATSPAAAKGFARQEAVFAAGYLNEDFASAKYDDGLRMVATGEGAHYPMLTFAIAAIGQNYPDNLEDVGFFALPGDNPTSNGLTVWMPPGLYVPKTSEHQAEALQFVNFVASLDGCASQAAAVGVTGPFLVDGCTLPETVPPAVADLLPYFQEGGQTSPALEFLSPIKGPALEQITVEIGSGFRTAADGAALYDEDVRKQALQLGIAGW